MRTAALLSVLGLLAPGCQSGRSASDGPEGSSSAGSGSSDASGSASETASSEPTASSSGTTATTDPTTTTTDATSGPGIKLDVGTQGTDGDPGLCPCGDNADLVYLLSSARSLWTYDPATNAFEELGSFSCGGGLLSQPFSMGVARSGEAWVMFAPAGDLMVVDVNDANDCSDPGYTPGQNGFTLFGMAFVSDAVDDPCDTLYAHSFSGSLSGFGEGTDAGRLGRLEGLTPQFIADIDYDGGELTGTADGRLFAFAGSNPAKLVEYDKETGAEIDTLNLDGLELTDAFAFAFWGGDFYFFTEASTGGGPFNNSDSKVTRLDYDDTGELETVVDVAPLRVVGAGVSTCAPLVPPG